MGEHSFAEEESYVDDDSNYDNKNRGGLQPMLRFHDCMTDGATSTHMDLTSTSGDSSNKIVRTADNRKVKTSKLVVLVFIAISAVVCATCTVIFTRREEENDFELHFRDIAIELLKITEHEAQSTFGVVASLAHSVTSFANYTWSNANDRGGIWPNVTIPHFEQRGHDNNAISRALQISLAVLVESGDLAAWEEYATENQGWITEGVTTSFHLHQEFIGGTRETVTIPPISPFVQRQVVPDSKDVEDAEDDMIRNQDNETNKAVIPPSKQIMSAQEVLYVRQDQPGVDYSRHAYAPLWQQSPAPHFPSAINFDCLTNPLLQRLHHGMWETGLPVLSEVADLSFLYRGAILDDITHPHSALLYPVFAHFDPTITSTKATLSPKPRPESNDLVAFLIAIFPWNAFFINLLPEKDRGIILVLHDTCDDVFSYQLNGPEAIYLGPGDLHDRQYTHLGKGALFADFLNHTFSETHEHCEYDLRIYPSNTLKSAFTTNTPWIYGVCVLLVFVFTACSFLLYDYMVEQRQRRIVAKAKQTNKIVSALFPANVRGRILEDLKREEDEQTREDQEAKRKFAFGGPKSQLKNFLDENPDDTHPFDTKPIADLFPNATVLFADIKGFTAWSSVREPSQVFTLLESIYHAFDQIARQRHVFKVETIGDCYVAVTGLPDPRPDHALVMCRFARDCVIKMNIMTKKLEVQLGPDTGDLMIRVGIHSGPVTAGVLRGDKQRFQLFGDTVNTASRMESTGEGNRIHISEETASILKASNKAHWLILREDVITAKGKGSMHTYFLDTRLLPSGHSKAGSERGDDVSTRSRHQRTVCEDSSVLTAALPNLPAHSSKADRDKQQRLVDWNVDVLWKLVKEIMARREATPSAMEIAAPCGSQASMIVDEDPAAKSGSVIDEVSEIIHLPAFDKCAADASWNISNLYIDPELKDELTQLVGSIAALYRDNPFHNFQHASHVSMSVTKLLSRIVSPYDAHNFKNISQSLETGTTSVASTLHDHTYGITSDPLTQFACVFAALIHDVDHSGLPNSQLVKERSPLAIAYDNKSVAEQNSVDLAWKLFMDTHFSDLRHAICPTAAEMVRFRKLVVNSVMATDIVDKELKKLRNERWDKAFSHHPNTSSSEQESPTTEQAPMQSDNVNRKATIVIEHLIQASDVAHTMQHWHVYRKWNEMLFLEMYTAYRQGHAERDPATFWYTGEIGFFDFYIIPLAMKLKDCGVFGVSSDEYLNYATKNRTEWEHKGMEVVAMMVEKYAHLFDTREMDEDEEVPQTVVECQFQHHCQ